MATVYRRAHEARTDCESEPVAPAGALVDATGAVAVGRAPEPAVVDLL